MIDWLTGALRFVFLETVWGIAAIAMGAGLVAAGIASLLRMKDGGRGFVATCVMLAGASAVLFLSGENRYRFERETLEKLEEAPWAKVVQTTKWGDIIAPRTWFDPPVGHFVVAQPEIMMGWSEEQRSFRVTILAFKEEPSVSIAQVDCSDRTAIWASPDRNGTFVYKQKGASNLTDAQYKSFCKTDWSEAIDLTFEASRQ